MRLGVTGSRDFADVAALWRALDILDAQERIGSLTEGASDDVTGPYVGADYWAHQWALAHDRATGRFHAEWKGQGKAAGPIRNREMAAVIDKLLACPGNAGTRNMITEASRRGVPVVFLSALLSEASAA